ncbi:hypothetical protein [Kitasatospora sp. NPDC088346]|uniref:hypothetical protein n=1 Tax=Kitasatospora sp. NPDC088346 TaxID=3364073 RepID=UPI00380054BE
MTAPGPIAPPPGSTALAVSRPAVVLWSLIVIGLMALLPCAGRAGAVTAAPASPVAAAAVGPVVDGPVLLHHGRLPGLVAPAERDRTPVALCTADDERPSPGSGCSNHSFCGPEAQLPNAPPQPAAVVPARLITVRALPCGNRIGVLSGPDHSPDLHALQVHRS